GDLNIFFFFGTRPEIIKLAPVIKLFRQQQEAIRVFTVFTGQQPNLMGPFLEYWGITPDLYIPGTMKPGQSLAMLNSRLLGGIDSAIENCEDSRQLWVVQGDTTSAFAASTVAYYRGVSVAHVEAGLRTFDMESPFPEEFNRRSIALLSALHFAPTIYSRANLLRQGVAPERIFVTGNTGIDAVRIANENMKPPVITTVVPSTIAPNSTVDVAQLVSQRKIIVLLTMHRRENKKIMRSFYDVIRSVYCLKCVYIIPVHPNPAASEAAREACAADPRLLCVKPLPYEATQYILNHSRFIMTDSGGLQEESTFYSKPTIVLRESTERPEAVMAGQAIIVTYHSASSDQDGDNIDDEPPVGFDLAELQRTVIQLLEVPGSALFKSMSAKGLPFGDGYASEAVVQTVLNPKTDELLTKPLRMVESSSGEASANHRLAPHCTIDGEYAWTNCVVKDTVTVVLTAFKRNTLAHNLQSIVRQTMKPKHIFVVQNGDYLGSYVKDQVELFRVEQSDLPVDIVHFTENSFFHGRFHVAYFMAKTEYVSIWDDDVQPGDDWLKGCIEQSKEHNDALIGGTCRTIQYLMPKYEQTIPFAARIVEDLGARNDFVGHSWTLKREFLKYFFEMTPFTYRTGEDMQLSFALQRHGIETWVAKTDMKDMNLFDVYP
ncbi:unnamed protein product, partial [Ectocarpus fasciculatus]